MMAVSLFSGVGGFDVGLARAGIESLVQSGRKGKGARVSAPAAYCAIMAAGVRHARRHRMTGIEAGARPWTVSDPQSLPPARRAGVRPGPGQTRHNRAPAPATPRHGDFRPDPVSEYPCRVPGPPGRAPARKARRWRG